MKKFYIILTALAATVSMQAGDLKFMLGDKTIAKGETVTFNEIEDDGYGTFIIAPDLAVIDTESTTAGVVVAECTSGQDIQMCAGGNCMRGKSITKTGLTFTANVRFPLQFEYSNFTAESAEDLPKNITVNFTAEDGLEGEASLVVVLNGDNGAVGAVLGDKAEVRVAGRNLMYKVNGQCTLTLHNILGVRAMQTTLNGAGSVALNDLPKGIYVYTIQGGTNISGKISIP